MNPLLTTSSEFNIEAENACASLLSKFNSNYINDLCNYALSMKDAPTIEPSPNIVNAAEITFNQLKEQFPVDQDNIMRVRDETHLEIIDRLCRFYEAQFIDPGYEYHFILARNMYYFLACGYSRCLIKFMAAHIYKNKEDLYQSLNIAETKKSKDTATIYSKKLFKNDQKLGLIIVNINEVLNYILGMDIPLEEILRYIFIEEDITILLCDSFKFTRDFYDFYKDTMKNDMYRPMLESNIVLQLQNHYTSAKEI